MSIHRLIRGAEPLAQIGILALITLLVSQACPLAAAENPFQAYLRREGVTPESGRISLPGGAAITLEGGLVMVTGRPAWELIGYDPVRANGELPPHGVIFSDANASSSSVDYDRLPPQAVSRALLDDQLSREWLVLLSWEAGWIDPSLEQVHPAELLTVLRMYAKGFNGMRSQPFGASLAITDWSPEPALDPRRGLVTFGLGLNWQARRPDGSMAGSLGRESILVHAHLGRTGTLKLVARGPAPARPAMEQALTSIASRLSWSPGQGFQRQQPDGVAVRAGGVRSLIVPRLGSTLEGEEAPTSSAAGSRLRFGWLLWCAPLAVVAVLVWRKLRSLAPARPAPVPAPAAPAVAQGRCHACGSPLPGLVHRCTGCGASLVRR
ncbi:MAG: hypothetical protein L6R48_09755 [Planctomycetes bacterium]|nr:hypothetical protein [Planctomycetota bacterium]